VKHQVLGACALIASACLLASASAMAAAPKPAAVVSDCGKLLPASRLASLTGGTFSSSYVKNFPTAALSTCGFDGSAQPGEDATPADAMHPDISVNIISGTSKAAQTAIAKEWKTYSQPPLSGKVSCTSTVPGATPRDPRDCVVQPVTGLGDRAAEFNDYIVVQKGSTVFQIWAGNNGLQHLSYDQLETVAKYLLTKTK
jgi:hypothetical protein